MIDEERQLRTKALKRFLIFAAGVGIVIFVGTLVFFNLYLAPLLKTKIEEAGSSALGSPLQIEKLSLGLLPTPHVVLEGVTIAVPKAQLTGRAPHAQIALGASLYQIFTGGPWGVVSLDLQEPSLDLVLPTSRAGQTSQASEKELENAGPLIPSFHVNRDVGIRLSVQRGRLHVSQAPGTDVLLEDVKFALSAPNVNVLAGDVSIQAKTTTHYGDLDFKFPLDLSSAFALSDNLLKLDGAKGSFFGLSLTGSGWQNLASGRADWKLNGLIPELANLQIPPTFLPPGRWSGKIAMALTASAASRLKGWQARGLVDVTQLKGTTLFEKNGYWGDGDVSANGSLDLTVKPGETFARDRKYDVHFNKGYLATDFTQMAIAAKTFFQKKRTIPLVFYFAGAGDQKSVSIEKLDLKFANLSLHSKGVASLIAGQTSALSLIVDKTDLTGWETYLPPLAQSKLRGFLQVNAEIKGDLAKPEALSVNVNPFLLEKFDADLNWISDDRETELKGPLRASARLELSSLGQTLRNASLTLDSDLTGLSIQKRGVFQKPASFPLSLHVQGSDQRGQQIEIKSSNLHLGSSALEISGHIANPQRPLLDLKVQAPSLNLAELTKLSPPVSEWGLAGIGNGKLRLGGTYDFKLGLEKSPLRFQGDFTFKIPSLKIAAKVPGEKGKAEPTEKGKPAKPEPLLPDWPIARTAQVRSDVTITDFQYGDLAVRGIRVTSNLNTGELSGNASVNQVFQGRVNVNRFRTRLTVPSPDSTADMEFAQINVQDAAAFASPDWRELVKGSASGKMRALVPHPSTATFTDRVSATGSFDVKNGFLSTASLDKMINESLAKIPGVGSSNTVNSKGVTADITGDFSVDKKVASLSNFVFLTPEKNELRAQGTIGFDKSMNLSGVAFLATAPVGGSIRAANSDAQGRFVIPLKINGNLMKPEIAFAQESVRQILAKTAEYELKKNVQNKLDQLKDSVQKKGLEGLKDLFK